MRFFISIAIHLCILFALAINHTSNEGHSDLEAAMRAHGNFAEYVPLALMLMGLAESLHAEPVILVVLGCVLTAGRHWHAQGLVLPSMKKRVRGMKLTFGSLAALAAVNVVYAINSWMA